VCILCALMCCTCTDAHRTCTQGAQCDDQLPAWTSAPIDPNPPAIVVMPAVAVVMLPPLVCARCGVCLV
jgi:hypothetical protein